MIQLLRNNEENSRSGDVWFLGEEVDLKHSPRACMRPACWCGGRKILPVCSATQPDPIDSLARRRLERMLPLVVVGVAVAVPFGATAVDSTSASRDHERHVDTVVGIRHLTAAAAATTTTRPRRELCGWRHPQDCVIVAGPNAPPSPSSPPREPPARWLTDWSSAQCVGELAVDVSPNRSSMALVRNMGGGTSTCCHMHPEAAPARIINGSAMHLQLLPRLPGVRSRNGARTYLAESCSEGSYASTRYAAMKLLGATLSVTVDLSAAYCGCVAAFYLVSMAQNTEPGNCGGDRYCDANKVCNVACTEIDLMEANQFSFHAALHASNDPNGLVNGQGGGHYGLINTHADKANALAPLDNAAIDTRRPFRVHTHFETDAARTLLLSTLTTLTQTAPDGSPYQVHFRTYPGRSQGTISAALARGMTPTFSYWSSHDVGWLDSRAGCHENQDLCADTITFKDLALCDDGPTECYFTPRSPPPSSPPPSAPPCTPLPPAHPPPTPPIIPPISPSMPPPRNPSPHGPPPAPTGPRQVPNESASNRNTRAPTSHGTNAALLGAGVVLVLVGVVAGLTPERRLAGLRAELKASLSATWVGRRLTERRVRASRKAGGTWTRQVDVEPSTTTTSCANASATAELEDQGDAL